MEMVQINTPPREILSPLPGLAVGGGAPAKPARGGGDPLLFAALLLEIPLPAAAGAGPADAAPQPIAGGKGLPLVKSKSGRNTTAEPADQGNGADVNESLAAAGCQLAQLSALAVRLPEGESRLQAGGKLADGEEFDNSAARQFRQGADRQLVRQCETTAGTAVVPAQSEAAPDAPEQSARPLQISEMSSGMMQAAINSTSTVSLNSNLISVNLPLNKSLPLQGGGQEGDGISLRPICPIPTPTLPSKGREVSTSERSALIGSSNILKEGAPSASTMLPTSKNLTEAAPQGETAAESATPAPNRPATAALKPMHSAPELTVTGEKAPLPSRDNGVAGAPAETLVEVVFADPSGRGGFPDEERKEKTGAKDKAVEGLAGQGMEQPRSFAPAEPHRAAMQPKVDEAGRGVHESILAQVRESVVSHDGKGNGRITVRLNPAELGELQIQVRVENQQVKVEIITDNSTVRDALLGNMDFLKETLLKQNLNMARFDVSTGGGNGFNQGFREDRGGERHASRLPVGQEVGPLAVPAGRAVEEWGAAQNSLVDLRL